MKLRIPSSSRFSLWTLFLLVTLLAVPLGWIGREWRIVEERKEVRAWLVQLTYSSSGSTDIDDNYLISILTNDLPWYRRILGDELNYSLFPLPANKADQARVFSAFPEAKVRAAPRSPALRPDASPPPAHPDIPPKVRAI